MIMPVTQLADSANIAHFSADATRYFSGEFIFMIFGLPGAALAMFKCAKQEKKKQAGSLLLSATLACMFTGITEPLEFSFLFVAPALFAVQVVLAGSAYMIAHILNRPCFFCFFRLTSGCDLKGHGMERGKEA